MQAAVEVMHANLDAKRLEEIYRTHHPMVFRAACRVTGNAADAEDVLQTVFLRMVRRSGAIGDVAEIESYLYRAAVNAALDLVRSRQKARDVPIECAGSDRVADSRHSPDKALGSREIRRWLRSAVARLSPTAAEAFVLRFFEDKKNAEIAVILGTTPSTIAVTLHRARERLEREYRAELGEQS